MAKTHRTLFASPTIMLFELLKSLSANSITMHGLKYYVNIVHKTFLFFQCSRDTLSLDIFSITTNVSEIMKNVFLFHEAHVILILSAASFLHIVHVFVQCFSFRFLFTTLFLFHIQLDPKNQHHDSWLITTVFGKTMHWYCLNISFHLLPFTLHVKLYYFASHIICWDIFVMMPIHWWFEIRDILSWAFLVFYVRIFFVMHKSLQHVFLS